MKEKIYEHVTSLKPWVNSLIAGREPWANILNIVILKLHHETIAMNNGFMSKERGQREKDKTEQTYDSNKLMENIYKKESQEESFKSRLEGGEGGGG